MRASSNMLLAAGPLALWGAWAIWMSLTNRHWIIGALGGVALVIAGGLLCLTVWAKYLAYFFAVGLALSWAYAVWQVISRGWPYDDWLTTVVSLIPGAFLLIICAGGSWVIHKQYRQRTRDT